MTNLNRTIKERFHAIDIIRGLIMVIMALDHTRDFLHTPSSPLDMQTTTVILFFTRWVTHYCAPTFVFLSGVSVFLAGQRRSKKELSLFLLKRGLWLILSDLIIMSFLFSFDIQYHLLVLEVLTAIGFGMILLAGLIYVPRWLIATLAVLIIFGHNALDYIQPLQNKTADNLLKFFLTAGASFVPLGANRTLLSLYPPIAWAGPLLLGYVLGTLYQTGAKAKQRQTVLLLTGFSFIGLFILLRLINQYGNPVPWATQRNLAHTLLSFLNTAKQPPSLLFLLMTLGPVMVLLAMAENFNNKLTAFFEVYGNVPYFFFIAHFFLLRVINLVLIGISGLPYKSDGNPIVWQAQGFGFPLWAVYLFWAFVVAAFYFPCKWYGNYKRTHKQWWLSYL
nr:heparan-alpha-glucosaminide N-acetyltransferase domain-containing protein [uncultured Mucilaginibacter sp.]